MSTKRKFSIGCGVLALFVLGVVTGFVGSLILITGVAGKSERWNTEGSKKFITGHLAGAMKLDEEQKAELAPIVAEALDERWELRQEYRESTDKLFVEKYGPRVEEILTEEQKERLRKRWNKWRRDKGLDEETGESVAGKEGNAPSLP